MDTCLFMLCSNKINGFNNAAHDEAHALSRNTSGNQAIELGSFHSLQIITSFADQPHDWPTRRIALC